MGISGLLVISLRLFFFPYPWSRFMSVSWILPSSPGYFLHPLQTSIIALNPVCICVAVFPITLEFLRDMPNVLKSVICPGTQNRYSIK